MESGPWALDWHDYVWGEELERLSLDQLASADTLLEARPLQSGCVILRYQPQGDN